MNKSTWKMLVIVMITSSFFGLRCTSDKGSLPLYFQDGTEIEEVTLTKSPEKYVLRNDREYDLVHWDLYETFKTRTEGPGRKLGVHYKRGTLNSYEEIDLLEPYELEPHMPEGVFLVITMDVSISNKKSKPILLHWREENNE